MSKKKEELSANELLMVKEVADSFNKLNKKLQIAFIDKLTEQCQQKKISKKK